jgi:hypothetical protein
VHRLNANGPKTVTEQPLSNVTVERAEQEEKQLEEIVVTEEGIQIERSELHSLNANGPISVTEQPLSNVTINRALQ